MLLGLWVATDESRRVRDVVLAAMARLGLARKVFADRANLSEKQLSDQLTMKQPLNLYRLADVPGFLRCFLFALAEVEHCSVYPNEQVTLVIHVHPHGRPMLKASLPPRKVEDVA